MANSLKVLIILDTQHVYDRSVFEGFEFALRSKNLSWDIETLSTAQCQSLSTVKGHWDAVIANADSAAVQALLVKLNLPTVAICGQPLLIPSLTNVTYICPDHEAICQLAINHFLMSATPCMATFAGFDTNSDPWVVFRQQTFEALASKQGINSRRIECQADLQSRPDGPLSVFCMSDRFAKELIMVSENLGLSIPNDIAIIGVDFDRLDRNLSTKKISTVPFLAKNMGRQALFALVTWLDQPKSMAFSHTIVVSPEPIEVGSTTREITSDALVNQALAFIRKNFHTGIKAEQVAMSLKVSRSHLNNRFKQGMGISVHDALMKERLNFVTVQLIESEQSVSDIANQVGFASKTYLYKCFKQHYAMSPQEYRQLHRPIPR